jgi:hypothetical protein
MNRIIFFLSVMRSQGETGYLLYYEPPGKDISYDSKINDATC